MSSFTVKDILAEMDRIAPLSLTEKGDNSGLLAGLPSDGATKVLAALDITNEVVEEAIAKGADVIISHHPVIYHPLYSLSDENPACRAMKNGIACLCFHSPLDLAKGGINDIIFDMLKEPFGLCGPEAFVEEVGGGFGYGLVCRLKNPLEPYKAAEMLKNIFKCSIVRYTRGGRPIEKLAFCSGGAGSMLPDALRLGADAYITGDVKHDQMITALNFGATLFDCGHFHTENIVIPYLAKRFAEDMPEIAFEIAERSTDPCNYV
ncbi:MAG: Nif3-like dinuclear metal center hexameric protein [Oscillospiraceae bacterium]